MLSKIDVEKELGTGINIVPFYEKNLKENSINLSASEYAWSMCDGNFYLKNDGEFLISKSKNNKEDLELKTIKKGSSAIININNKKVIILLPYSTTLILTEEVIAVNNHIGGTYHSKVGIVSQGIGHIGTMLGPNFCGHSLIAVHNVSDKVLKIPVGDTFVSLIFNYLKTPINTFNATRNGHLEKFTELGLKISSQDREFIDEDWKSKIDSIREQMEDSQNFKEFKKKLKKRKLKHYKKYLNKKNFIIIIGLVLFFFILFYVAKEADSNLEKPIWADKVNTILTTAIVIPILQSLLKKIQPSM